MNGKHKCKILKQIRRQIAQENDIRYVTSECKHQGDCSGTCPKCEAEVRYLEDELKKRQHAGKAVAVAGIATALMLTASGCQSPLPSHFTTAGDVPYPTDPTVEATVCETEPSQTLPELMGKPLLIETAPTETLPELMGVPLIEEEIPGDIAFPPGVQGEIACEEP